MRIRFRHIRNILILLFLLAVVLFFAARYIPFTKLIRLSPAGAQVLPAQNIAGQDVPNSILIDFEVAPGKEVPGNLEKGNSHSGQYSAKAFGKNSFSPAVLRTAGELGPENLKAVAVSAWIFVKPTGSEVNGAFVFAASNPLGVNVCWKGVSVKDPGVPRGKWFKISGFFDLAGVKFKPDTKLELYFWNNSSTDILVDDYYIVYGGPLPRRGDSALVDLTKHPYAPRFNFPPFEVEFLDYQEIPSVSGIFLTRNTGASQAVISPDDLILTGKFLNRASNDEIFSMNKKGQANLFTWCSGTREFRVNRVETSRELQDEKNNPVFFTGSFLPGGTEQILGTGKEGAFLGKFISPANICSDEDRIKFETFWTSSLPVFSSTDNGRSIIAADLNGDGITELLSPEGDGQWSILHFQPSQAAGGGKFTTLASSKEAVPEWNSNEYDFRITAGHFIPRLFSGSLLTVFKHKKDGKYGYSLRFYNATAKKFISYTSDKNSSFGKTTGLDTLKPEDRFFTGNFVQGKKEMVLRYNRDWRFDLKSLIFSDSAFRIIYNLDFRGFALDRNPKYYEVLRLVPFRYKGDVTSFLVIGRNCNDKGYKSGDCTEYKELPGLPSFIGIYSLGQENK